MLVKDGKVYINGSKKALSEPYIKEEPVEDFGPYKVPKNGYFVMGGEITEIIQMMPENGRPIMFPEMKS